MTSFITTLGDDFVTLLVAGMPYLDPTRGGTCRTATDAKSVFDLGLAITPAVVVTLLSMTPVGQQKTSARAEQLMRVTWRNYIVGANFNRGTASGRTGELDEPGTDQMIADMISTCHGKYVTPNASGQSDARLYPSTLSWLYDTGSKIIYQFDWTHTWLLTEVGTGAWAEP